MPRFRVGVLHDQDITSLTALTGYSDWRVTNDVGQVAVEVPWNRGVRMLEKYEKSIDLKWYASVGEMIIMNLARSPAPGTALAALKDAPKEQTAASKKRALKKAAVGNVAYHKAFAAGRLKAYLRHAQEATQKLPADYYGSSNGFGMWRYPDDIVEYNADYRFLLFTDTLTETEQAELRKETEERTAIRQANAVSVLTEATQEVKKHARQIGLLKVDVGDESSAANVENVVPCDLANSSIPILEDWTWDYNDPVRTIDPDLFMTNRKMESWFAKFATLRQFMSPVGRGTGSGETSYEPVRTMISFRFRKLVGYVLAEYPYPWCRSQFTDKHAHIAKELLGTMQWMMDNINEKKKRKYLSHIGEYIADWVYTEMLTRAGRKIKNYPIKNGSYRYLYDALQSQIATYLKDDDLQQWNNFANHFSKDEAIGDMFETFVAVKCFNSDCSTIMMLLETVFYDEHAVEWNEEKQSWMTTPQLTIDAEVKLALVRTWVSGVQPEDADDPLDLRDKGDPIGPEIRPNTQPVNPIGSLEENSESAAQQLASLREFSAAPVQERPAEGADSDDDWGDWKTQRGVELPGPMDVRSEERQRTWELHKRIKTMKKSNKINLELSLIHI